MYTVYKYKSKADKYFDAVNILLMAVVLIVMLYPIYFVIIASVSEPSEVVSGNVFLFPKGFTLDAYKNVFKESRIWIGYRNTLFYTVFGTLFNLTLTIPTAYVLSKKELVGQKWITFFFLIPMYFTGGLIPTYLQIKSLGLLNTVFTLVVINGISIYNVIVSRVYFQNSIPEELYESVRIDGGNEYRCFFQFALPLAKPILAVMTLFYAVEHWNNYFNALIYTSDSKIQPLQMVLRGILLLNQTAINNLPSDAELTEEYARALLNAANMAEAMKYALIFIASAPMLILYPFVQKYFIKGIMIGSLKG